MSEENNEPLNIVAVFAHPDDEVGVIGTLANHSDRGDNVYVIFLTKGENASTIKGSHEEIIEIRKGHVKKIEKILGAKYRLLDLPDSGVFPSVENAQKLALVFKELRPDIIVTWSQVILPGAGHPDHRYTHSITLDALSYARYRNENHNFPPHRKTVGLYTTYFINDYSTSQPFFVEVTEQFDRIIKVLQVYEEAYGKWPVKEYKISMMSLFGQMSGVKYAEAFNKLLWRRAQSYLY